MTAVVADGPALSIARPPRHDRRVPGLDGIRGLAALYVVVHHCWLLSFPGYPVNTGPGWLGWLIHGRLAVVVFITLSGFSLAISPARNAWQLGGTLRFVALISTLIVTPRAGSHLTTFWITAILVIPFCLTAARLFAAVFETPFQRRS